MAQETGGSLRSPTLRMVLVPRINQRVGKQSVNENPVRHASIRPDEDRRLWKNAREDLLLRSWLSGECAYSTSSHNAGSRSLNVDDFA